MTNREIDCVIMGLAAGGTTCLWLGYQLRVRVERWQARRAARHKERVRANEHPTVIGRSPRSVQNAQTMLAKHPRIIPLTPKRHMHYIDVAGDPTKVDPIPLPRAPGGATRVSKHLGPVVPEPEANDVADRERAAETARMIYEDAVAALVDAGFKRNVAMAAVKDCTLVERAGGLESWVAAALRRAATKRF